MRGDTATLAIESRRNLATHILCGHTIASETPLALAATLSDKNPGRDLRDLVVPMSS